ncbi:hypothetical protein AHAS_Ahas19G0160000 [Arachis hypogaea]
MCSYDCGFGWVGHGALQHTLLLGRWCKGAKSHFSRNRVVTDIGDVASQYRSRFGIFVDQCKHFAKVVCFREEDFKAFLKKMLIDTTLQESFELKEPGGPTTARVQKVQRKESAVDAGCWVIGKHDVLIWYFLAEIEELEQKSDLETEKALQMLSRSDLLELRRAFLELQKSKWSILNGYGKLTSRDFQKYIIVHTLLQIIRPKTGVQRQLPGPFQASSAQGVETSVQTPKEDPLASVQHPRGLIARGSHLSSAQTLTKWAPEVDFRTKNTVLSLLVIV